MRSLWEPAAMSSRQCSVAGFASRGEADFANKQRHLDNLAAKDRSPPPTDPQHGYQASELVVQIRFEGQLATLCGHSLASAAMPAQAPSRLLARAIGWVERVYATYVTGRGMGTGGFIASAGSRSTSTSADLMRKEWNPSLTHKRKIAPSRPIS